MADKRHANAGVPDAGADADPYADAKAWARSQLPAHKVRDMAESIGRELDLAIGHAADWHGADAKLVDRALALVLIARYGSVAAARKILS